MSVYQHLDAVAEDFRDVRNLLSDPNAGSRLDGIDQAIARTAELLGNRPAKTELEKDHLATLYRMMLAMQRVLASLREHHANART
ncbi:MAG: type III secretion protein [Burkholderiaceae bacterium]